MKKLLLTYIFAIEIEEIYIVTSIKKREHKKPPKQSSKERQIMQYMVVFQTLCKQWLGVHVT